MKKINLEGRKFGKVLVLSPAPSRNGMAMWNCVCDCGKKYEAYSCNLRRNHTKSCGCDRNEKHGMCGTKIYKLWHNVRSRVHNPKAMRYERYGGRGISICDEWNNSFDSFMKWCLKNGYKEGLQIDRIDNDGNYEPSNCRFVTNVENCNNRKITDAQREVSFKNLSKPTCPISDSLGNKYKSKAEAGRSVGVNRSRIFRAIRDGKKVAGRFFYEC